MNQQARVAIADDTLKLPDQEFYVNTGVERVDLGLPMAYATNNTMLYGLAIKQSIN